MNLGKILGLLGIIGLFISPLQAGERRVDHVFIISFDQGGGEIIKNHDSPEFKRMFQEGAATWRAYTIVPSITLPSHTSMLTGVGIQEHQVDWNNYNPEKGLVQVPTIFSLAKKQSLSTAMFVGKEKFKHLLLPGSVDTFYVGKDAPQIAAEFAKQVGKLKPNLCFIHFPEIDSTGHQYGVNSPEQIKAITDCDEALKVIREAVKQAGIESSSVFILTADHGGHERVGNEKNYSPHGTSKHADVDIPWVAWGKGVKKNFSITAPVLIYDTSATALWLLDVPVPESFWGKPVTSAFE